jgi:RNA polymerase sigma-70 factor, ECF subfamily
MSDISAQIEVQIPRLRRYALVLTHSQVEADELVQDCLVRAFSKIHLWEDGTDLSAWLFTIMHNQCVNKVRRWSREGTSVPVGEDEPLLTYAATQGARLELRDLHRALSQLPKETRTATAER